jgi:hypothetical protein
MPFHHKNLTVYQCALDFAAWSQQLIESVNKKTSTRDPFPRGIGRGFFKSPKVLPLNLQHVSICSLRDAAALKMRSKEANGSSRKS